MAESLGRVIHIFYGYSPHSGARFNTQLTKPVLPCGGKTNHVQQLFKTRPLPVPRMLPRSSLMFSHLLEVPESPRYTIITYSRLRVFQHKLNQSSMPCIILLHHSQRCSSIPLFPFRYSLHANNAKIYKEIHLPDIKFWRQQ